MNKKQFGAGIVILAFIMSVPLVYAGSKDLTASKRSRYEDDGTESMRDVFRRMEQDEKDYRATMLANSEQTVQLLKEVRDLLKKLNDKK